MRRVRFGVVAGLVGWLGLAASAGATVTYLYEGNNFNEIRDDTLPDGTFTTDMRVEVSLTLAEPLAPDLDFVDITADLLDARAFNGRRTYVLGEELVNFDVDVVTDSSGDIIFWFVNATKNRAPRPGEQGVGFTANRRELGAADLGRLDLRDESGVVLGIDRAVIESNPGTWTLIPEPATASLMGLGLLGLAASAGRGRR